MKVLLCAHSFAPSVGGAETLALLLARGASDRVSMTVVTGTPAGAATEARWPFTVVRRPGALALWRLIRDADVVHLAGPLFAPMLMARLARRPFVVEHHAYQAVCPNGLLLHEPDRSPCPGHFMAGRAGVCLRCRSSSVGWLGGLRSVVLTWPRRWLARGARLHIAVSAHVARRIALPASRTIYHGIAPLGAVPRPSASVVGVAFVGRLVREKGVDVLLRAMAMLAAERRAIRLRVIGDGPERARLEALSAALGLEGVVEFAGWQGGDALDEALSGVAAVVMPSIWEETAGFSAIEAMWRGRAVVAAATGGLAELVADAGLLFEAGSAEALAAALRRLVAEPELADQLGAMARARAERLFRLDAMIEQHHQAWAEACS